MCVFFSSYKVFIFGRKGLAEGAYYCDSEDSYCQAVYWALNRSSDSEGASFIFVRFCALCHELPLHIHISFEI